jgi:DNA-binding transcriptional LysR family regulator
MDLVPPVMPGQKSTYTPVRKTGTTSVVRVDPSGPLLVQIGAATDLAVDAAIAGTGIMHLFEDWLRPHLDSGALEPVLEPWWQRFSGPFLYYPGRRLLPAPLRAFVDFIKSSVAHL